MKITTEKKLGEQEVLVLGMFEEDKDYYKSLNKNLHDELTEAIKEKRFEKKFGEFFATKYGDYKKVLVLGIGRKEDLTLEKVRQLLGKAVKAVKGARYETFTTNILEVAKKTDKFSAEELGRSVTEALILANYRFDKYLSKEKRDKCKSINLVSLQWGGGNSLVKGLKMGRIIAESTNFVKDLVNEQAAIVTPAYMEKVARRLASSNNKISVKVMGVEELKKAGLNALLGVGKGSVVPPRLIFLHYQGGKGKLTALIGKGITFDSGGYNLKPTRYIEDMKSDMGGAAAVLGTIKTAAELGLKKNLLGVMPLAENMIGSKAQRPGDIVKAYNGKTIEIGNTDAEGRLVLCDALSYTEAKYKPEVMIDLATLTGAVVVALGYYTAGLVGKDQELLDSLKKAGLDSGDRVWELPFFEDYQNWMDGSITDLNNVSTKGKGYEAGSVTAGVFLSKFVEKAKWAHIDIAGSAYWSVDGDYTQKGATGAGVRVLSYYLMQE